MVNHIIKVSPFGNYIGINYSVAVPPNATGKSPYEVLKFDRCTGVVTSFKVAPLDKQEYEGFTGFSPNERFFYYGGDTLWQCDLWTDQDTMPSEIVYINDTLNFMEFTGNSRKTVGLFKFFYNTRAGKVIGNFAGGFPNHTIHYPNEPGMACMIEPKTAYFRDTLLAFQPNQPTNPLNFSNRWLYQKVYYRVYDLADSPCDTLGIDDPYPSPPNNTYTPLPENGVLSIAPNPTSTVIQAYWQAPVAVSFWAIHDLTGRLIWSHRANGYNNGLLLDATPFAAGTYLLTVRDALGRTSTERLVVE
jgi:hypothetical protein